MLETKVVPHQNLHHEKKFFPTYSALEKSVYHLIVTISVELPIYSYFVLFSNLIFTHIFDNNLQLTSNSNGGILCCRDAPTSCAQSEIGQKCSIMHVHLTAATKMWLLTSLAFFYLIIQYHVSNTWPLPATSISIQENEVDTSRKLWLKNVVGDTKLATNLQNLLGEKLAQDLAQRIGEHVQSHSCLIRWNNTSQYLPPIYIVTPTYRRPEQRAELTRLSQTLMHVENIYWLLIEDAKEKSIMVAELLNKTGIRHIHLNGKLFALFIRKLKVSVQKCQTVVKKNKKLILVVLQKKSNECISKSNV